MGKRKRKPPRTLPGTEVLRILGRIGATIHKPNKSSHAKVIVPLQGDKVLVEVVPFTSNDLPIGTFKALMRRLGPIERQFWEEYFGSPDPGTKDVRAPSPETDCTQSPPVVSAIQWRPLLARSPGPSHPGPNAFRDAA